MSKNKTLPQKCFCLCHCASSLILAGPSSLKHEVLAWLWSLGGAVSTKWTWTKLHVLERTVEWSELQLDVRVTPCRLQEAAWLGKTTLASQAVSDQLQVTWLLTFRPEGGGAPSEMGIRACAWEKLMKGISEPSGWVTERSIQRGKDSCSQTQGQIERAGPWEVERTVKTGLKVWQSQGMLWAGDNRTVEGRQGSGLAGQGGESPYVSRHLFSFKRHLS